MFIIEKWLLLGNDFNLDKLNFFSNILIFMEDNLWNF